MKSSKNIERAQPLVSIVVTTCNEGENIENCLRSINAQTWSSTESIVVDNGSTDRTLEITRRMADKTASKGPERSAQRNYGMIELASGKYVIYIDADMILSPVLIEACVKHIHKTGAVALHVPEIVLGTNFFSRVRRFERGFYDGTPVDGARFFDRVAFIKAGGFDEVLFEEGSGEDWDIDKTIRKFGVIELLPRCSPSLDSKFWSLQSFVETRGVRHLSNYAGIYHNEADFRLLPYLQKKSYYSIGFNGYINKWGESDPDIQRQFGLKYRYWSVFVENGKWKSLLKHPGLTIGMYLLRFCVGLVYLYKIRDPLKNSDRAR